MVASRNSPSVPHSGEAALVIGNFDGVHRGHQALVAHTIALARQRNLRPMVMTFDPHPAVALGGTQPPVLTRLERKIELLRAMAADLEVIVQRFDREFAQLTPEEFVERVIVGSYRVRELVVGRNFRFGRGRAGGVERLEQLGRAHGFFAHGFELAGDAQGSISSSRIRQLIAQGNLASANALLGRPHAVAGVVVRGDGRGRTIGVPTANLEGIVELSPEVGVYACRVELLEGAHATPLGAAVVHVGPRPTVERDATVEAHLLEREIDLYGKELRIAFVERLRGLVKFPDLNGLKRQIELDIAAAREILLGELAQR